MEDMEMRAYDFAPLGRSSIGFDRLFDLINNAHLSEASGTYPPYDIVRNGSDSSGFRWQSRASLPKT
jgi:molecular chaperone IbpA